jgi:chromosome partitioning protein
MRRIAVANQKGGTGKTTTAVNLAVALVRRKKKVLLIDLDPQGNASTWLNCASDGRDLLGVLGGQGALLDIVQESRSGVDVIPTGEWLAGVEKVLASEPGAEVVLKEAIDALPQDRWDILIMDCPPSLGLLSVSALVAAHEVLVPVHTEAMPLEGVAQFLKTMQRVQGRLNPGLELVGVLPSKTDTTKLSKSVEAAMRSSLGKRVFKTVVRKNVKVAESYSHRRPISDYAPKSPGTEDYDALALEVLKRAA